MSKASLANTGNAFPCAISAWAEHEQALVGWLLKETGNNRALSEDLLQEVFVKLMQQRNAFCEVENTKGWLFRVARNLLIDHARRDRYQPIEDTDIAHEEADPSAIDLLAINCLPRVLNELDEEDRDIIFACDINGMKQQEYAEQHLLSLPAVKSRLRRARQKLKQQIETACHVQLDENEQVCCFTQRAP
ncbi:sigma-70 family RNA polymerase sigma factor [Reinekea marinisedimentorum]|uniref:RNA polymerase sigma-70 factor (ECF subfamily) n=1 Tax=Reinekea marinisedimentorum TaxID=230495 RepID=A0A4R3HTU5_9GAMM|nr:sigma-70 family RNA polymerase sigma factor [Reinekea marinisedimentorum]TCS35903.1 RNA polymerase sigma-70 factor (ECF subfamily) [Reinekea marinisedimentorum]